MMKSKKRNGIAGLVNANLFSKRPHRQIFIALYSLFFVLFVIFANTIYIFHDDSFYDSYFEENGIYDSIQEVEEIDRDLRDYLVGKKDSIEHVFLNEKEKTHMIDVRMLYFRMLFLVIGLMILIIIGEILLYQDKKRLYDNIFAISYVNFAVVAILLFFGFLMSLDFKKYFIVFHKLIFTNDLWLMGVNDRVTDIYTDYFFQIAMQSILLRSFMVFTLVLGIAYCIRRYKA